MKTRLLVSLVVALLALTMVVGLAEADTPQELKFDKYYIIMPALNVRADPDTPGVVGEVVAGQEVEFLYSAGNYSQFNYQDANGETQTGATWTGAIAPAVRIHLLQDAFIFTRPGMDRTQLGSIITWREPTDPDLLILWEEEVDGEPWFYIVSIEDCRAGYMKGDIPFEIVQ